MLYKNVSNIKIKDFQLVENVIVVLNYNDFQTCIQFIREIISYEIIDRLIIVDNNSTDGSIENLEPYANGKVLILKSDHNQGYAYGNNFGMKFAVQHFPNVKNIIISNPDIHVSEQDIKKIINKLYNKMEYGLATGLIYNFNTITKQKSLASNFGWLLPTYGDMISNCFLSFYKIKRSILRNSMYLDWDIVKNKDIIPTEAVPGCFFVLNAEVAQEIGYFDERTFLFGEENIIAWRLKHAGYKACIVNKTKVLHENSVSINKNIKSVKTKALYRLDAELLFLREYLECNMLQIFLYRIIYKLGSIEKFVITQCISWYHKFKREHR